MAPFPSYQPERIGLAKLRFLKAVAVQLSLFATGITVVSKDVSDQERTGTKTATVRLYNSQGPASELLTQKVTWFSDHEGDGPPGI
jgi:hypothetical protein